MHRDEASCLRTFEHASFRFLIKQNYVQLTIDMQRKIADRAVLVEMVFYKKMIKA